MKSRRVLLVATSIAALAMLLPVTHFVNPFVSHLTIQGSAGQQLQADGNPFPPLPPGSAVLVADGNPFPPIPPKAETLVADGNPFPPLPPHSELLADGNPFPPLPPRASQLISDGNPFPPLPPGIAAGAETLA